jgi:hypothetical protein
MRTKASDLSWGLVFGIVFGFLLHKGGVTNYDVIIGQLLLTDFAVLKIMLSAVVVGAIGIHTLQSRGWVKLSPRGGSWGKNAIGGLVFGVGFAVLGYCPGTIAGAIGSGRLDALIGGLPGILLGSWLFAVVYPRMRDGLLRKGPFEKVTLPELVRLPQWGLISLLSVVIALVLTLVETAGL